MHSTNPRPDRAIELKPTDPNNWISKGRALNGQGKYNESLEAFDKAIELKPNYADAWKGKSDSLAALNRSSEAHSALVTARKLGYKG